MEGKEEILKAIEPYKKQQGTIIEVIKKHGGKLTRDEFDKEFGNYIIRDGKAYRNERVCFGFCPMYGPFLGNQSQGDWSKWLDLLQHMIRAGLVNIGGHDDGSYYELVEARELKVEQVTATFTGEIFDDNLLIEVLDRLDY